MDSINAIQDFVRKNAIELVNVGLLTFVAVKQFLTLHKDPAAAIMAAASVVLMLLTLIKNIFMDKRLDDMKKELEDKISQAVAQAVANAEASGGFAFAPPRLQEADPNAVIDDPLFTELERRKDAIRPPAEQLASP